MTSACPRNRHGRGRRGSGEAPGWPHRLRAVLVAAWSVALGACAAGQETPPPAVISTPDGLLVIRDIGAYSKLPRVISVYRRGAVTAYGEGARDFSVNYYVEDSRLNLVSTVYFYALDMFPPGPMHTLEGHFEDSAAGIAYYTEGDITVAESGGITMTGRNEAEGLWARFEYTGPFGGLEQPLSSELNLFFVGDHAVKFRHTYPRSERVLREQQINDLMRAIDWSDPRAITDHFLRMFEGAAAPGIPGLVRHPADPALDGVPDAGFDLYAVEPVNLLDARG